MGKRMTKAEANALVWLIIIGLPLFVVVKFIEAIGVVTFAIGGAVIVAFAFWYTSSRSKARQLEMERLREKQRIASLREADVNGNVKVYQLRELKSVPLPGRELLNQGKRKS